MKIKNERRRYRRLPLSYSVEITSPKTKKRAKTKDISIKGMCIISSATFKENAILKINLSLLPDEKVVIPLEGKILWKMQGKSKEYHYGLLITSIKKEDFEIYRRFLARKLIDFILE